MTLDEALAECPAVAIIHVEGVIASGGSDLFSGASIASAKTIIKNIDKAKNDNDVKAIILAVDSPGGGVVASDEIYHALKGVGDEWHLYAVSPTPP